MQNASKRGSNSATPQELRNWSITREQIGHQLKKHYQACTNEELSPRLLALLKKLDEELEPSANPPSAIPT